VIIVGGVDTYYDYDERRWKFRRLGGGPIHEQTLEQPPRRPPEEDAPATTDARTAVVVTPQAPPDSRHPT
jgi:hypothetical protein